MFKKIFNKDNNLELKSPMTGKIIPIEEIPDQVFSGKMVGDGLGIDPSEGILVSPIDGEVAVLFPTNHAIALKSKSGIELLLHIGIDTVNMKGEGFESFVKIGDKVSIGQKLIEFDLDLVKEKAKSPISPILVTNMDAVSKIDKSSGDVINSEDKLMIVEK